jgi:DNA-binding CsgD family transcriptional regulator
MGSREGSLLAFGAVALVVSLAALDTAAERATFGLGGFALEFVEWAGIVGALVVSIAVLVGLQRLKADQAAMRDVLPPASGPGDRGQRDDVVGSIRRQFKAWQLTSAEADVAELMLKGVSLRDIAQCRRTSATTIRQQAQGVYRKSGVGGRAELAAFFLDAVSERITDASDRR